VCGLQNNAAIRHSMHGNRTKCNPAGVSAALLPCLAHAGGVRDVARVEHVPGRAQHDDVQHVRRQPVAPVYSAHLDLLDGGAEGRKLWRTRQLL
jgi:hypothetical protein